MTEVAYYFLVKAFCSFLLILFWQKACDSPMFISWYTWLFITAILLLVICTKFFNFPSLRLAVAKCLAFSAKTTFAILLLSFIALKSSDVLVSKSYDLTINLRTGKPEHILPKSSEPAGAVIINELVEKAIEIVRSSTSSNPLPAGEIVAQAIRYLQKAQVFHNIPDEMKVGVKEIIQVSIAKELTQELIQEFQQTENEIAGEREILYDPRSIVISLAANPDSFKIYPVEEIKQLILPDQPTRWRWEVIPLKEGSHLLELRAFTDFYVRELGAEPYPLPINIFSNRILVTSNFYSVLWKSFCSLWKDLLAVSGVLWVALYFTKEQRNMSETPKYDMRGSTFGSFVDTAQDGSRQQVVQNISIAQQQQTLTEAAKSIQELLDYLSKTYSLDEVPGKAEEVIKSDPQLRGRVVGAIKESGKKALEELIKHPSVSILLAAVEGWEKGN